MKKSLESQVTAEMQKLAPEFAGIVEQAKKSITAIRISLGEDFDEVNAMLKANGAGSLGTNANNAKILNHEARPEDPRLLGTMGSESIAEQVDADLTAAEKKAETRSPSKRTERLGVDIGEGLKIGLERKTKDVKSQADQLAEAAIPKVDTANQAKYDAMKNDPEQRQIQKSIDRHYRDKFGSRKVPVPTSSESTETSLTVDVDPKALMSDMSAVKAARQKANELEKQASDAEAAAAKIRTEAAKWEEVAAREKGKNMHTAENARDLKKLADEAEVRAAEARIKAAEAETAAANLEGNTGSSEQIMSNGTVEAGDGMRRIVEGADDGKQTQLS